MKLSTDYEAEQRELTEQVKTWREVVEIFEQDRSDFDSFAAIVRKYVGIRELTPTIVNEFVKKIIVHAPDKSSGHRRQKIELVWNFIGEVNLPGDDQTVERQKKRQDGMTFQPCRPATIKLLPYRGTSLTDFHFFTYNHNLLRGLYLFPDFFCFSLNFFKLFLILFQLFS